MASSELFVDVQNNNVVIDGTGQQGILIRVEDNDSICAIVSGNTAAGSGMASGSDIELNNIGVSATFGTRRSKRHRSCRDQRHQYSLGSCRGRHSRDSSSRYLYTSLKLTCCYL